jgi:hypothetical protein
MAVSMAVASIRVRSSSIDGSGHDGHDSGIDVPAVPSIDPPKSFYDGPAAASLASRAVGGPPSTDPAKQASGGLSDLDIGLRHKVTVTFGA